jgi:hypothetical protein
MAAFFDAFWPNLAATAFGVVLGLPFALYLNRRLSEHQSRLQTAETRQRLTAAINVLVEACEYNIRVLNNMTELSLAGKVMHNPDLRVTTWDAVGAMFSNNCYEPDLVQILSHHWLRLRRLEELNREMFAREVGSLSRVQDEEMAIGLWQELRDNTLDLSAHTVEVVRKLDALKS